MSRYTAANDPDDDVDDTERLRIDDDGTFVGDDRPDDDHPDDGTYDRRNDEVTTAEAGDDEVGYDDEDDDSWWDEGVVGLILVAGLALFLFPEPATSGLGVALLAVGAALWVVDWLA